MRKFRVLSLLLLAITFITLSCTKEGPEGPAGATGAQGPAGANGSPGTPGAGTTTYSAWYTTVAADWTTTGVAPYKASFLVNRAAPAITQDILDNGVVLAYVTNWIIADASGNAIGRSTDVAQLPLLADLDFFDYYDFVTPGVGSIRYLYKSGAAWNAAALTGTKFRYVAIKGSLGGGRSMVPTYGGFTANELKAMPYEQVLSIFNIPAEGTNAQ